MKDPHSLERDEMDFVCVCVSVRGMGGKSVSVRKVYLEKLHLRIHHADTSDINM